MEINKKLLERNINGEKLYFPNSNYIFFFEKDNVKYFIYGASEGGPVVDCFLGRINDIKPDLSEFKLYYNECVNFNKLFSKQGHYLTDLSDAEFGIENYFLSFSCNDKELHITKNSCPRGFWVGNGIVFNLYTGLQKKIILESETTDYVRMRVNPTLFDAVVLTCKPRQKIHVIERTSKVQKIDAFEDYWYFVETEEYEKGWIFGGYIDSPVKSKVPVNFNIVMTEESEK